MGANEDGDVGSDEAAWRDLVARFDLPVDTTAAPPPWPAREDLTDAARRPLPERDGAVGRDPGGAAGRPGPAGPGSPAAPARRPCRARPACRVRPACRDASALGLPGPSGSPIRLTGLAPPGCSARPGLLGPSGAAPPGPAGPSGLAGPSDLAGRPGSVRRPGGDGPADGSPASGLFGPDPFGPDFFGSDPLGSGVLDGNPFSGGSSRPGSRPGQDNGATATGGADGAGTLEDPPADRPGRGRHAGGLPGDRARIVRRAVPPPAPAADDDDEDGRYVPPPPEPLPQLDPVAKAAWVGLLGGPVYLVVASLLGDISSWAALLAIAAFIAGGVTLFLRMSDRPRDDDDDGAVV